MAGGQERAAARLAEHRKKWDGVDMTPIPSRQQARALARWKAKRARSLAKTAAMRDGKPGGAASVR